MTESPEDRGTVLVTGASSGIGQATVRALAAAGFEPVAAARRIERCEELVAEVGGRAAALDVTDQASVDELAASLPELSAVVHSAGGALGLAQVAEAGTDQWQRMYDTNVLGVMRGTRAVLPALARSGRGDILGIRSGSRGRGFPRRGRAT